MIGRLFEPRRPAADDPPPERREWMLALGVLLFAAVRLAPLLSTSWPHTTDDAWITLRYSRHLADGLGLVWNVGEAPVEGYSNFLFVLLGAALIHAGIEDPMPWLKALGAAALVGSSVLVFAIGRRWLRPAAAAVPVVLLSGYSGTVLWAVSGLETAVFQFLVLLSALLVILGKEEPRHRRRLLTGAAAVGFVLSLTRPEGPVIVAVLLLYVAFGYREHDRAISIGATARLLAPFLSLYLPYFVWRALYFGRLLPNSVVCKAGHPNEPTEIIADFFSFAWVYGLLALVPLISRRDPPRHLLLWGIPLAYVLILYDVNPIMSHHNRHFLAALPFLLIAATLGLQQLVALSPTLVRRRAERWLVTMVVVTGAAATLPGVLREIQTTAIDGQPATAPRLELASYLQSRLRPHESYVIGDTGLVPFTTGGRVLDAYCLNSAAATDHGHQDSPERYADWLYAQQPHFVVIQSFQADAVTPVWEPDEALASHPTLRADYRSVATFGRPQDVFHYHLFERREGS